MLWKWRNMNLFQEDFVWPQDPRAAVFKLVAEVLNAEDNWKRLSPTKQKSNIWVSWVTPPDHWVKLDTNGASRENSRPASAVGVIRNCSGEWMPFGKKLGLCCSVRAELWALRLGLLVAKDNGFRRVMVEADSLVILQLINDDVCQINAYRPIICDIQRLMKMDWEVCMNHTYCEGNRVADFLTNYILDGHECDVIWLYPPALVHPFIEADSAGVAWQRRVANLVS
ncbi:Ribonuclease H [Quillaja saponaria]|uniref:Ribonuclease H n=1 Tax=Quillaja saponaria TaxID=32244 RepID=A0AAD7QEC2_QUISA|nr:Ribonuclease H [Quillaja saponaria]